MGRRYVRKIMNTTIASSGHVSHGITRNTSYYICKILVGNTRNLKSVVVENGGTVANSRSDLNRALASLYIEESEITRMAQELEILSQKHWNLSSQISSNRSISGQLIEVERRMFWILGFKTIRRS